MTPTPTIGIVLPGAHRWHRAGVINYALALGIQPILLVQPNEVINEVIPAGVVILKYPSSPTKEDFEMLVVEIGKHCARWYVLPLDDYISEVAAMLSQYAITFCYPVPSAYTAFHKHALRECWNQYCQEHPELPLTQVEYALFYQGGVVHLSEGYSNVEGAFIVKPDAYSGSVGVLLALNQLEVTKSVEQCAAILNDEAGNPEMHGINIDRHVLVEKAIPRKGDLGGCAEFTAHYLSLKGQHYLLGIAEKTINTDTYIETGHIFPSPSFPAEMQPTLHTVVKGLMSELEVQNTISNWEFIITPDNRLVMVEGQLRPSGDHVMDLMENAFALSPFHMLFKAFHVDALSFEVPMAMYTSMIYWPSPSTVTHMILEIEVPENLPPNVHLYVNEEALKNARNWQGPVSWYHRHICIVSTAMSALLAKQQCTEVLKKCRLKGVSADGLPALAQLLIA